jgi:hypothetical protein
MIGNYRNTNNKKSFFSLHAVSFLFCVDLRPDFCGSRPLLLGKAKKRSSKTPDIHVVKSIITAKITPKTVPAADSANEVAAGADG